MIIIDGTNLLMGRLSTYVAKKALEGEKVVIVNSEKVIISGKKEMVFDKYKKKREKGGPLKGPFIPRKPDRMLRRTIRGMLPYKTAKGKEAFGRIMCYVEVPGKYQNEKLETLKSANFSKLKTINYTTLDKLSNMLGGK